MFMQVMFGSATQQYKAANAAVAANTSDTSTAVSAASAVPAAATAATDSNPAIPALTSTNNVPNHTGNSTYMAFEGLTAGGPAAFQCLDSDLFFHQVMPSVTVGQLDRGGPVRRQPPSATGYIEDEALTRLYNRVSRGN